MHHPAVISQPNMAHLSILRRCTILFAAVFLFSSSAFSQTNATTDSDGDGLADLSDACPNEAGVAANNGCPARLDKDGDLVADKVDQCPDMAGPADNNGCPPGTTKAREAQPTSTVAATPASSADLQARVEAARQDLYTQLIGATPESAAKAIARFGDKVRNGLGVQTGSGLEKAIEPVMRTKAAGNIDLAIAIAKAWNTTTGFPYSSTIQLLPVADRTEIENRAKAAAAQKEKEQRAVAQGQAAPKPAYVSEATRKAAEKKVAEEKKCKALMNDLYLRGISMGGTIEYEGQTCQLKGQDCDKDEFTIVVPGSAMYWGVMQKQVPGYALRTGARHSWKTFKLCGRCSGRGKYDVEDTREYTRELPQGYFSGVRTTSTTTRTEIKSFVCGGCKGTGMADY